MCNYKINTVKPCNICPRLITALYKCELLQETLNITEKDLKQIDKIIKL